MALTKPCHVLLDAAIGAVSGLETCVVVQLPEVHVEVGGVSGGLARCQLGGEPGNCVRDARDDFGVGVGTAAADVVRAVAGRVAVD
jgi:hypothetical protein